MQNETKQARTRRGEGFAGTGAVRQTEGPLPIYVCNACNLEVVWATSRRTGRKYLVNVHRGYLDQRYYIAASIHKCEREG